MIPSKIPWALTALLSLVPGTLSNPQTAVTVPATTTAVNPSGVAASAGSSASSPAAKACNNSPLLCSRAYNNITHLGAHNSAFLRDSTTAYSIAGNQYFNATAALSAGVRLLQAQVHLQDGVLRLCHSLCELLDAGPLDVWLGKIRVWIDQHPSEVVSILLVNADRQPAALFGAAFDAAGLSRYGYVPTAAGKWPTLAEMIAANTRVVTFLASAAPDAAYPFLLDEFAHVFETPFNITRLDAFGCALDRPSSRAPATSALSAGMLPLLNHFAYTEITSDILIPRDGDIDRTNSPSTNAGDTGALGLHAATCMAGSEWGVKPTFVLVDFFDKGPAMDAVDAINGIKGTVQGRVAPGSDQESSSAERERVLPGTGGGVGRLAMIAFLGMAVATL